MPFLGKSPKAGNFILLDSITTSATATYNLTRNSTAFFPVSARNLIVSLNGITQAPDTAYSVSGSTITFSSALTSSDVIDYILVLGEVGSLGTPADNTVGESQLNYPLTNFSSTGIDDNAVATALTIKTHSGGTGATVGIGSTNPTAYSGSSALHIGDESGESELYMLGQYQTYIQMQADGAATSGTKGKHILYLFNDGSNNITVDNRLYSPRTSSGGYNTYKYYLDASTGTSDYAAFYTNGFERLRIDGSGNVGIGTSSPNSNLGYTGLTVNGSDGGFVEFETSGTLLGKIYSRSVVGLGSFIFDTSNAASDMQFRMNDTTCMRIISDGNVLFTEGNVGIGTSTFNLDSFSDPALAIGSSASGTRGTIEVTSNITTNTAYGILAFTNDSSTDTTNNKRVAQINATRNGNNNTADLDFITNDGSSYATRMQISASGDVGIGIAPTNVGTYRTLEIGQKSGSKRGRIQFNTDQGNVTLYSFEQGTQPYLGIYTDHASGTYIGRFDSDGLKFGSDTAAANALDDYEEGTWTPVLTYGGGNTGQVMTSNVEGTYVKIGSLVTANIRWTQSTKGTSTGAVALSLPFAVDNTMSTTALEAQGSLGYYQNVTVTHSTLLITAWHSSSTVQFYYRASDTSTNMTSLTDAHVGDGFDGRATVTYRTT